MSLKTLIIRQGIGLFLLEGSAIVVTNYLRQMLILATGFYFDYYLKLIGMVITMISGVFVLSTASQRSIHDYLAKTRVVGEDEKPVKRKEKKKPKPRSEKEQNYISNAKRLLMEKNQMTEEEAYRHIQKCSMDSGTNMVETAQMLLMLMYDEI